MHPATPLEQLLIIGGFIVFGLGWCIWDWWLHNHNNSKEEA